MKYLKDKNSRRRGVAIELAIMLLLVMAAVSTIITTTTMIQINKQKESFNEVDDLLGEIEKIEYDHIGTSFKSFIIEEIEKTKEDKDLPTSDGGNSNLITQFNEKKATNILTKLDDKFRSLKSNKHLVFDVTVSTVILNSESAEQEILQDDNLAYVTKDAVLYEYKMTFELKVSKVVDDVNLPVMEVEFSLNLSQTVTTTNTYEKEPIEVPTYTELKYAPNVDAINIYLQEGYKIQFAGISGITLGSFTVTGDHAVVSKFEVVINDTLTVKAPLLKENESYTVSASVLLTDTSDANKTGTVTVNIIAVKSTEGKMDTVTNVTDEFYVIINKQVDSTTTYEKKDTPSTNISQLITNDELDQEKWNYIN